MLRPTWRLVMVQGDLSWSSAAAREGERCVVRRRVKRRKMCVRGVGNHFVGRVVWYEE